MAYELNFSASNKADFFVYTTPVNIDTNTDIDVTAADITIKIANLDGCPIITATLDNGLVTLPAPTVIELHVPAAMMAALCPGSYLIDCVLSLNGEINQPVVGNLTVWASPR